MKKKIFRCEKCGYEFEVVTMEREEAIEKRVALVPIACPRCKEQFVKERR